MIFNKERWDKIGGGFFVRDCTLGFDSDRIGFLLVEEIDNDQSMDDGWQTRLLAVKLSNPMDTRFYYATGNNFSFASITSAWEPSQTEFVIVDTETKVWSYKPKTYKGDEKAIPFVGGKLKPDAYGEYDSVVKKLVRVGTSIFAVGGPWRIFERLDAQQWLEHKDIPIPPGLASSDKNVFSDTLSDCMFNDLAGYSTQDMYAVGEAGAVWHRKGKQWRQIHFPTNLRLHTVAAGGDGFVYITDIRGSVWKGREDTWELVVKSDMSLPFADAAWFDNRLWLANDYGTWVLEGKSLVPAHQAKSKPMPAASAVHSHRIDVSPDGKRMLVCGAQGASWFDGQTWEVLFDANAME
jgi:hypothetical protein